MMARFWRGGPLEVRSPLTQIMSPDRKATYKHVKQPYPDKFQVSRHVYGMRAIAVV